MSMNQITQFDEAREAGMTADQASRWVAYVDRKRQQGEEPIALWEAMVQLQRASDEARIDRVLRDLFARSLERIQDEALEATA